MLAFYTVSFMEVFLIAHFKLNVFLCMCKAQDNLLFLLFVCLFPYIWVYCSALCACSALEGQRPEEGIYPLELELHTY